MNNNNFVSMPTLDHSSTPPSDQSTDQASDQPTAIGIDFGGTSVKIGVVQGQQILELATPIPTEAYSAPEPLIEAIASVINDYKEKYPDIVAVGGGVPGFVHAQKGIIYELPNVNGWLNIEFNDTIEELTSLPCAIDNDANAMAYAEWKYGAGKGKQHLICITLGTGLGAGIISSNRLIQGSNSSAAELGQTSIDYQGKSGKYNNTGAIEDYIGNRQIAQYMQQSYREQGEEIHINDCSPAALSALADQGDALAISIWENIAEKLACTIVNACWLFNPEAVVIGGGVSKAGKHIFDPLEKLVKHQLAAPFHQELSILPAHFGNHAGLIGAANIATDALKEKA